MHKHDAVEEYVHEVASQVGPKVRAKSGETAQAPLCFTLGRHEAAVAYCRHRGIHPAFFRPVLSWPNLTGYGTKHGYKLILVRGWSEVDQVDRIIKRARLFGFEVCHE